MEQPGAWSKPAHIQCCSIAEDGSAAWDTNSFEADLRISLGNQPSHSRSEPSFTIHNRSTNATALTGSLTSKTAWRASSILFFFKSPQEHASCLAVRCASLEAANTVESLMDKALGLQQRQMPEGASGRKRAHAEGPAESLQPEASAQGDGNPFDAKIDKGSAEMYFKYYGMLQHQQNMLQDYVRTGIYHRAITSNKLDFRGKTVMDVGAGSGILSLFAAQAGASKVYAVEASGIVGYTQQLADGNADMGKTLQVIHAKVEEVDIAEKVDVLISEPMGTLLVNERMLETYLYARDRFLKPGGKMFPQVGRIHVALFSDAFLHQEVMAKATFWTQDNFFKVDLSSLYGSAVDGYFSQVVVDAFDTNVLVSDPASKILDLGTCTAEDLQDVVIPLDLEVKTQGPCAVHGLACWFDVLFPGTNNPVWLTTAPGQPTTHWFQLRCLMKAPIYVPGPGHRVQGSLHLKAHKFQSYDVHLTLTGPPAQPGGPPQTSSGVFDLKEPYYRQLTPAGWWGQASAGVSQEECQAQQYQQQQQQQQWGPAEQQQWAEQVRQWASQAGLVHASAQQSGQQGAAAGTGQVVGAGQMGQQGQQGGQQAAGGGSWRSMMQV
uniref:type I protein arginine methyltransferase n=2 Tax=Dunaliella tertiolecta TaxID=3047 RepID=A0A7S3VRI5_DUNTE